MRGQINDKIDAARGCWSRSTLPYVDMGNSAAPTAAMAEAEAVPVPVNVPAAALADIDALAIAFTRKEELSVRVAHREGGNERLQRDHRARRRSGAAHLHADVYCDMHTQRQHARRAAASPRRDEVAAPVVPRRSAGRDGCALSVAAAAVGAATQTRPHRRQRRRARR